MTDIFNEAKDFIVSIGTETLKEKGENIYNEKKIQNELMDYTDRELMHFENIDRNREIDIGGLKQYIIEKLIEDFRDSLYGDIEERERKKTSILECLYSYVQADNQEKKQYVNQIFLNAYTIIEKYYETNILNSESIYLAKKIVDDIHQDIKQCLDVVNSLQKDISAQTQQTNIFMIQHGEKNRQFGQVTNLTINNE